MDNTPMSGKGGMAANGDTKSVMPSMLQRTTTLLKDTSQLVEEQRIDAAFGIIRRGLLEEKRRIGGGRRGSSMGHLDRRTSPPGDTANLCTWSVGTRKQYLCLPGGGKDHGACKPTVLLANPRPEYP